MAMTSLCVCVRHFMWILLFAQLCYCSPPKEQLEIPFLEEQSKGSEVYDLQEGLSRETIPGVYFKMLQQYMTVGSDIVNSRARWVSLDERSGVISVKRSVDRERDCIGDDTLPCVIHVKIVRKPQKALQLIDINLNVIDINDHSPVFPITPLINVNVSESVPLTTRINIDRFLATDADTGPNANIYYTLSRSEFFSIHTFKDRTGAPHIELVVTDKLDHETATTYDLTLTATDRGTPQQKSSSVTLRVTIMDANDNPPVFDNQIYRLELKENLGPSSTIATVHAEDKDSGDFGKIRYFVSESGNTDVARNLVAVDPVTGEVFLTNALDREKHNNIHIAIEARDLAGSNSKVGKTILTIQIDDENDNAPLIQIGIIVDSNENTAFLSESSKIGTYVAQVTADDADVELNGRVDMSISTRIFPFSQTDWISIQERAILRSMNADDVNDYFVLDDGGFIITGKHLNREEHPGFLVNVLACDQGAHPLCSSKNLTILLLDENDNDPRFLSKAQSFTLPEDTDLGHLITTVEATDRDSLYQLPNSLFQSAGLTQPHNGRILYKLDNGPGCFNIDEITGNIRVSGSLDYEKTKTWKLHVIAKDMGMPSRMANLTLLVHVSDVNDNVPLFANPAISNQTIPATIQSGDVITKIKAIDFDDDGNSKILYSIISEDGVRPPPSVFILDRFKGNLLLNMSNPDLDKTIGSHSLVIKAEDSGTPPLAGYTTLLVEVYDLPLSSLPEFPKTEDRPGKKAKGNFTVILIVSLASATILLVLILVGVIFKCKKENKEIRTYNCRSAESKKKSWRLSSTEEPTSPNDVLMVSSNRSTQLRDSKTNSVSYLQNTESHSSNDMKSSSDRNSNRSSQRSLQKKMASFSKDSRFQHPLITQLDGDSGRGDSDHDAATETGSFEDKNKAQSHEMERQTELSSYCVSGMNSSGSSMGPLCTHLCRQYGHSDTCWMPASEHQLQEAIYYPAGPQRSITSAYPPNTLVCSGNVHTRGLETICETQALHSVLSEDYDPGQPGDYQSFHRDYVTSSATVLLNSTDNTYYSPNNSQTPSSYWNNRNSDAAVSTATIPQCPGEGYCMYASTLPHHDCYSPSEQFHDGLPVNDSQVTNFSHYQPGIAMPGHLTCDNNSVRNSSCGSPTSSVSGNRRSNASLHGELLQRRFLAQAHNASRIDDVEMTSSPEVQYGEVTMQETQQILDNIDQLIDK